MFGSSTPGAGGLQGFLVSPFVEPLDVAVASQEAVSRLQFAPQQVQEVIWKMAPSVVELAHYNVSGPLGSSRGMLTWKKMHSLAVLKVALNKSFFLLRKIGFPYPTKGYFG